MAASPQSTDEAPAARAITFVPWRPPLDESIRDAWRSRHLIGPLAGRAIPRYTGYKLGRAWLVLRPLFQLGGFTLLINGVFHQSAQDRTPVLLTLTFGFLGWDAFSRTLISGVVGARDFKALARNLKVPFLLLALTVPLRAISYVIVYLAIGAGLVAYYAATRGHVYLASAPTVLIGFAGTALCVGFAWALAMPLSLLYLRAKDVRYALRYTMSVGLLATPVLWPLSQVHGAWRTAFQLNPLTGAVLLVKHGFLGAPAPPVFAAVWSLSVFAVLMLAGVWLFNRHAAQLLGFASVRGDRDETDPDED